MNLASTRKDNCDDIIRNYMGVYKVLLLLNECGDPSFLVREICEDHKITLGIGVGGFPASMSLRFHTPPLYRG